jgi:hypothetical protein
MFVERARKVGGGTISDAASAHQDSDYESTKRQLRDP